MAKSIKRPKPGATRFKLRPSPGSARCFWSTKAARHRIEWRGDDRYGLRGLEGFEDSVEHLLEIADRDPARLSPGVLARPGLQDAVLGSCLQLMGPAELSYMVQARAAYPILGIERTWTTLRPHILAIDPRQMGWVRELELSLDELIDGSVESIVATRFSNDFISPVRDRLQAMLDELEEPVLELDKSFGQAVAENP